MLKQYYVVLDAFSLVYDEDTKTTALFESEERANKVADFLIKEKVKEGYDKSDAELNTPVLEFVTDGYEVAVI